MREDSSAAARRVHRYWFHVRLLVQVLLALLLLSVVAFYGNQVLDLWLEPPCSDGPALDGQCQLEVN